MILKLYAKLLKPVTNQRKSSTELNLPKSTVHDNLHRPNQVNILCKEIPHELTIGQGEKLLQNVFDERFFLKSGDEKWVYFNNSYWQNSLLKSKEQACPVSRKQPFGMKVFLCLWWNFEGIVHFGSKWSCHLNNPVGVYQRSSKCTLSYIANRKRGILQQDNAKRPEKLMIWNSNF